MRKDGRMLDQKMLENSQNMKVQFSVNLIIWFKVLRIGTQQGAAAMSPLPL